MSQLREINAKVRNIRDSKREALVRQALRIEQEIKQGLKKTFKDVINVSCDNTQQLGGKPLSFVRQVLAVCIYPHLINCDKMPLDVKERAKTILRECVGGSIGSYTPTGGLLHIQHNISKFISHRDAGVPSYPENIYITCGSQRAIMLILSVLVNDERSTAVLTPVPSYPPANSALEAQGAVVVPYYLNAAQGWRMQTEELRRALQSAREVCSPVALYVVNPGEPTGHVQSRESMEEVILFVFEEKLILMADEAHQGSVIGDGSFISYKRVLAEMGPPVSDTVELLSFHSASKGFMGECGLRGGYVELVNLDPMVMKHIHSLFTTASCAPVPGQIALDVMVNPPKPGDPSYSVYKEEIEHIRKTMVQNVKRVLEVLNSLPGISCQSVQGGASVFPRLHLPHRAIQKAKEEGSLPDYFYCSRLLEETGLCVCPGVDLGLREGTHHIRLCIMTPMDKMEEVLRRLTAFHIQFMMDFSSTE